MIRKFKKIDNFGIFKNFNWDSELHDDSGHARNFQQINIIYGRNYSGKTTLSRIIRSLETGEFSDKFEDPSFSIELSDNILITHDKLTEHNKKIRVFNEDFVRKNLRFISNPDDNIEPFAILGDDNNKIEKDIEELETTLGSNVEGTETGLYFQQAEARKNYTVVFGSHKKTKEDLEKQLKDKATNQEIGIKYKSERFGDQNYNIQKLKKDIKEVENSSYQPPTDEELGKYEKLIEEKPLQAISIFQMPTLNLQGLAAQAEDLVTKEVSESGKIEELVKNAVLHRWANEGRSLHENKRDICAFCDNLISEDRWQELDSHFDKESEQLEKEIDELIKQIETEKKSVNSALSIKKSLFYSKFHEALDKLIDTLQEAVGNYEESLNTLTSQLNSRKENILSQTSFKNPDDVSEELLAVWRSYQSLRTESNELTSSLSDMQNAAKQALRLKEVSDYLITIGYKDELLSINKLESDLEEAEGEKKGIDSRIKQMEELIASKKSELKDEEKGVMKVNEYLNNHFGHQFLTLEAKKEDMPGEGAKRIRFEVIRDGKKAYHLSEGECSLLAFCYFLAKLNDIDTQDVKPIIWIDDPISSLDGNHIFFIYSLLRTEIIFSGKFEQLFVSTHSLDFLKYLMRLNGSFNNENGQQKDYQKSYFVVARKDKISTIEPMPKYMKEYVTEFNYLFHQILKCSKIESVDDTNYTIFYNFANNARKFFEIYLYYKYPDQGMTEETLNLFFGEERVPTVLIDRINNEYSHLRGVFERGAIPIEVPEMQTAAKQIITCLKKDMSQFNALLKSIGECMDQGAQN